MLVGTEFDYDYDCESFREVLRTCDMGIGSDDPYYADYSFEPLVLKEYQHKEWDPDEYGYGEPYTYNLVWYSPSDGDFSDDDLTHPTCFRLCVVDNSHPGRRSEKIVIGAVECWRDYCDLHPGSDTFDGIRAVCGKKYSIHSTLEDAVLWVEGQAAMDIVSESPAPLITPEAMAEAYDAFGAVRKPIFPVSPYDQVYIAAVLACVPLEYVIVSVGPKSYRSHDDSVIPYGDVVRFNWKVVTYFPGKKKGTLDTDGLPIKFEYEDCRQSSEEK